MFAEARAEKEATFHTAMEIGRTTGDADLTFATMSYLGASLVHGDRTEEGMLLLDEALAAVAGGEVEDFIIVEEIFSASCSPLASTSRTSSGPSSGSG